jgi:hypothetical protein
VKSRTTERFRRAFAQLPADVQGQAREAYRRFAVDPHHPGLQFKKVHPKLPVYSARVNLDCRAVGALSGDEVVWFWIGPHDEYERLLKTI